MNKIPEGWRYGRLDSFLVLQRGFDLTQRQAQEGNVPVVSSSGISYYHNVAKVQPPGVVTGRKGKLGDVYYMGVPFWPHDTTLWVKDFGGNEPKFVRLFLEGFNLERFDAATSVPTLNRNNVHKLRVAFPSLEEQERIVEIIDTWAEAIALTERRIEAARQRKQGLMQRLLTGRVRFPEFAHSTQRRETKFGDLPVDWEYVPISKVAKEVNVRNQEDHNYPVLSCTKHHGLVDSLEYFGRQIFSDDLTSYKVVRRGQFAYATNHIEEGSIGYQDLHDVALISPMYTVYETKDRVDDSFLYKVLKTEKYRHIFEINTNGTVNRRGSLRWKAFSQIHIPLPSLAEQRCIAAVLQSCDCEIELLTQKRDALQRQKKGLMQRLLTGRVRVKV